MGHLEPISCGLIFLDGTHSGAVFKRSAGCEFKFSNISAADVLLNVPLWMNICVVVPVKSFFEFISSSTLKLIFKSGKCYACAVYKIDSCSVELWIPLKSENFS